MAKMTKYGTNYGDKNLKIFQCHVTVLSRSRSNDVHVNVTVIQPTINQPSNATNNEQQI